MRNITDLTVLSPVQTQNGFVFITPKETDDNKMIVTYKIFEFSSQTVVPVTRSVYLLNKFSINFESFQGNFKKYINTHILTLPLKKQLVIYPDGTAEIYDNFSSVIATHDFKIDGEAPCYAVHAPGCIWMSYSKKSCIVKYNDTNFNKEFRIGGKESGNFGCPEGFFADENQLLVCDSAEKKILRVDLKEFEVSDYYIFDEPVRGFFKFKTDDIAFLDSGAYIL